MTVGVLYQPFVMTYMSVYNTPVRGHLSFLDCLKEWDAIGGRQELWFVP